MLPRARLTFIPPNRLLQCLDLSLKFANFSFTLVLLFLQLIVKKFDLFELSVQAEFVVVNNLAAMTYLTLELTVLDLKVDDTFSVRQSLLNRLI